MTSPSKRRCINCDQLIEPEPYDAQRAKADYAANAAAWIHGFCSRWCMVAVAMSAVKSGTAWWQLPVDEIDQS